MRTTLASQGYSVVEAAAAKKRSKKSAACAPISILLDVNMPGISGLETCREIRATCDAPIIMLTVRNTERDKVHALDAGADDYVIKPFGVAGIDGAHPRRVAPRRSGRGHSAVRLRRSLRLTSRSAPSSCTDHPVRLTPKEFELLRQLVANQGKPIGHRRLLQAVWGPDYGEETEYLRVFINQLRKKIEPDPRHPRYIHTEPWVGYRFEPSGAKKHAARHSK